MNPARSCRNMFCDVGSYALMFSPSVAVTRCWLRAIIVPVVAIPMLPPMLRIRLNRLVALPIFSRGIGSIDTVVSGTKSSASPTPWTSCGQKMSQ